jgi:hypothetical protein
VLILLTAFFIGRDFLLLQLFQGYKGKQVKCIIMEYEVGHTIRSNR